jgi:multidrug efflux system membrane fusion protein
MSYGHLLPKSTSLVLFLSTVWGCSPPAPPVAETPPPPVTVSQPVAREVVDRDDYEGRIGAVQTVEVRARVRGHLIKVNFKDGELVKQGDLLFEIDPRPYQTTMDAALAQKASADAALKLAKAEYARSSSLARTGAASREEVDVWTAKQATAAAAVRQADAEIEKAQLDLDFTKVIAPINGKISRALTDVGNLVNAGGGETLLTTIVSVHPMYVYFDVDERALLRYRQTGAGRKADPAKQLSLKELRIPVYVGLEGESGYPHHGFLDFADNRVNPSTGTVQARGELPNPDRLLDAGMRARVQVPISDPRKALLITERAVGTDQGQKYVYVVNDQNGVERRDVKLGRLTDGMQIVADGLKPTDWVIVNGIQRVRDGMKVQPERKPMPGATTSGEQKAAWNVGERKDTVYESASAF